MLKRVKKIRREEEIYKDIRINKRKNNRENNRKNKKKDEYKANNRKSSKSFSDYDSDYDSYDNDVIHTHKLTINNRSKFLTSKLLTN